MNKTAMTILKDKILEEYQELREPAQLNEHIKGYREALKNIANDIDAQMMEVEKIIIMQSYNDGYKEGSYDTGPWAEDYYDEIYGTKNK
jgi:hypothetical protein